MDVQLKVFQRQTILLTMLENIFESFWQKKKGVPSVFLGPKNLSKSFELISVSE